MRLCMMLACRSQSRFPRTFPWSMVWLVAHFGFRPGRRPFDPQPVERATLDQAVSPVLDAEKYSGTSDVIAPSPGRCRIHSTKANPPVWLIYFWRGGCQSWAWRGSELREISGLALMQNGHVLTHDDEVARIYEIDPKTGVILKRFALDGAPRGDFEAITIAGQDIYLLESNGRLFKFRDSTDGSVVPYSRYDTGLGHECEFESLVFEPDSSRLLMACKHVKTPSLKHNVVIYRLPLPITDSSRLSTLVIPTDQVVGSIGKGWAILLGIGPDDTGEVARRLAEKIADLRCFEDSARTQRRSSALVSWWCPSRRS